MARVSEDFVKDYKDIRYRDLKTPYIFVVDMINGFCKEGSLADKNICEVIKNIQELLEMKGNDAVDYKDVMFFADKHHENSPELKSFPKHCMGDKESHIVDELKGYAKVIVPKNSTNGFHAPLFQDKFLKMVDAYKKMGELPFDIVITGCCTDICIMTFALSLKTYFNEHNINARVIIPINCVDTYHINRLHDVLTYNEFAFNVMRQAGIEVVSCITNNKEEIKKD